MSLIRFADFVADARTGELKRDGRRVRLPPQSFQVLISLTRAPGALVTREALQAELWPATSQVEWEQGLNAAINRLREALGDSAAEPKYIETLPRRGYRFIGALLPEPQSAPPPVPAPAVPSALPGRPAPPELTSDPAPVPRARHFGRRAWGAGLVLAAAAVALALWLGAERAPAPAAGRLVPATTLPGEERAPSLSSDGTRLAFAWNGDAGGAGGFDLYVKALDAEPLLRLTRAPAEALRMAWSPDGTQIAFARKVAGADGVFVVPALGGAERRIARAAFTNDAFMQLAWSPDARAIAYGSFDGSGSHVIHIVNVATLEDAALPDAPECWNAGLPAWSADGQRLAFVCNTSIGVYGVWVKTFDGAAPRRRAVLFGEAQGLAWSTEGSLIVANDAGDGGGLWRLAADGAMTRLPFGEEGSAPAVAGGRVAYVRSRQTVDIWRMDLTARDPARSAARHIYSTRREMTPQFSADGTRIAFQSSRSGSAEIWMAYADGANPVRLTRLDGPMAGAPQWCADGKLLAFDSRAAGRSAVYVMDVAERRARRVGPEGMELSLPVWSEDCATLVASDGRTTLYRVDVRSGAAVRLTERMSYLAQSVGDRIVFNVKAPDGVTLWSRALAGAAEAPLPGMPKLGYNDGWAPTQRGIYFSSLTDAGPALWFYEFDRAATRRVAALARPPHPGGGLGLAVSRDGHWLLYTQAGVAESDIMLMDGAPL